MKNRFSFFLLLCVGFLDHAGVGLVVPLFARLLFDPMHQILPADTSAAVRGMWLGVLIALAPLVQFFFAPILGSLSDQRGRKSMIMVGLFIGLIGFLFGVMGISLASLSLLLIYRMLFGVSTGTMAVIQAAIVDISTPESKARHFSLYNMALGIGFTMGPFLGGILSNISYQMPFWVGALFAGVNLVLLSWKFKETRPLAERTPLDVFRGMRQANMAFFHPQLRFVFFAFFLYCFGWDYFAQFVSVPLVRLFDFSTGKIGIFYAYFGLLYAVSTGLLTAPLIKRFSSRQLLLFSMTTGGPYLFFFLFMKNPVFFWGFFPALIFICALFYPVASTHISNQASEDKQGEMLGAYHSVQALAMILSPLFGGTLVGAIPAMPVYLGSGMMCLGGLIFALNYARQRVNERI